MNKQTIHALIDAVQRDAEGVRALTPAELDQLLDLLSIHANNDTLVRHTAQRLQERLDSVPKKLDASVHGVWGVRQHMAMEAARLALVNVDKQHASRPHILNGGADEP